MADYSWAFWLAPPVVATTLAATVTWLRARERRRPGPRRAVREHAAYLEALGRASARHQGPG